MKHQKENLVDPSAKITIINGTGKQGQEAEGNCYLQHVQPIDEDDEDIKCGIGACKPKWLQYLATKEVYMLLYSIIGLTQGMFFTYTVSVISTLEKRFKLSSKQTGTMLSGNDISQVILSMILSYYGNYGHRPRWMGVGVLFSALSCFLAAIPHVIYGPGIDAINVVNGSGFANSKNGEGLCLSELLGGEDDDDALESCAGSQEGRHESYWGPVVLLFISQFMVGIAISIFYTIGLTYLDDNINKKKTPIYYAISLMIRILGPVFGFFLGSKCLSIWINPEEDPNLTELDPRWLGAWWLGFLYLGIALVIFGGFLFFFPRKLPATLRRERKKVESQAAKDAKKGRNRGVDYFALLAKTKRAEAKPSMSNLKQALKRLFTNKIWVGNLFNTVVFILAIAGYWNFKPKYLESQFRKSASEANMYTGIASLVASLLGTGISGIIMRWARPGPRFVTGYNIFLTLFGCGTYISLMFIGCPKLNVIGQIDGSMGPPCSSGCGCSDKFAPICAEDRKTLFYSPCYAGCNVANNSKSPLRYSDCRCIASSSNASLQLEFQNAMFNFEVERNDADFLAPQSSLPSSWGTAQSGYCPEPCGAFKYYLILQIITKTIYSTGRVGSSIVHLRSVSDEDKALALGTTTVFISLFGFIPAPIIMGAIVDSACLVWDKTCGVLGNCWLYDSDKFRIILHLVPAVFVFISVFGDIVVYYYSRQLDLYGDRDDDLDMEKAKGETEESKPMHPNPPPDATDQKGISAAV